MLSDHGQSQGQPFAERWGTDLSDLCAELTRADTTGIESSVEGWGRVDSVLEDLAGGGGGSGVQRAASRRVERRMGTGGAGSDDALIVLGSGNLGLVYVPEPERLTLADIDRGGRSWCRVWPITRGSASSPAWARTGRSPSVRPDGTISPPGWSRASTRSRTSGRTRRHAPDRRL